MAWDENIRPGVPSIAGIIANTSLPGTVEPFAPMVPSLPVKNHQLPVPTPIAPLMGRRSQLLSLEPDEPLHITRLRAIDGLLGSVVGLHTAITAEKTVSINAGGDFDGNPLFPEDDALIHAGKGFTINRNPILPVQRDGNGRPVLDSRGRPVLVKDAVTVAPGFTTVNAPNTPYGGLLPPTVVEQRIVNVPSFATIRQQELGDRLPVGVAPIPFDATRKPLRTFQEWAQHFPPAGTSDRPTVVRITSNGLTIPDRVRLENTIILVDRGNINLNGTQHTLNNVVLVANNGSINLAGVRARNSSILASGDLQMNRNAKFGGATLLANGSNGLTFNGSTVSTREADTLTVVSQGRITYNAATTTRGRFIGREDFLFNGNAELLGSISTKGNIFFNSAATVTAIARSTPPTDTTPPELSLRLLNDTGASSSDRLTFDSTLTGTVTDASPITRLVAGLNGQPLAADITNTIQNGQFTLTRDRLAQMNRGTLPDGRYTLNVQAQDAQGNLSAVTSLTFDLDTTAPVLNLNLDEAFDTAPVGDRQTLFNPVNLVGATEAGLTVTLEQGSTGAIATPTGQFTFTGINLQPGDNPFTVSATDLAGNRGRFNQTITRTATTQLLQEDTFFERTLERSFKVPAASSVLTISFADLNFDLTDPNSINDAFEAALVDVNGNSLVHTISRGRDAFFNLTEGQPAALAAGVTLNNQTLSLNLAGIAPGTDAKLILRLVNNDSDTNTAVRVIDVALTETSVVAPVGVISATEPSRSGLSLLLPEDIAQLADVSASFAAEYGRTSFNHDTRTLYTDLTVRNGGQYGVEAPLYVAIDRLTDPTVQVIQPDGITPDGLPYFDLSRFINDGNLAPGEATASRPIAFYNPNNVQFDYHLTFLGRLAEASVTNQAPTFTSAPVTTALVGQPYTYSAIATDPDADPLTYSLKVAPQGMQIDRRTGLITWTPTATDVGGQSVIVLAEDGKGGQAEQAFSVATRSVLTNRPPVITSTPRAIASVSQPYTYDVDAIDPENDAITYTLTTAPVGMAIDPQTGLITWNPASVAAGNYNVAVQASDGRGNSDTQTFPLSLTNAAPGEIRGLVWDDLNANSIRDTGLIQGTNPDALFVVDISFSADDPFQGSPVGDLNGDRIANTILDAEIAGFIALNQQLINQGLGTTARVGVISFSGNAFQLDMDPVQRGVQLVTTPTADRDNNGIRDVEQALRSLRTGPSTNFEAGLQRAITTFTALGTTPGNGYMVFLSDGENTIGGSITDELATLNQLGVTSYAYGVGQGAKLNDGDRLADDLELINPNAEIFTNTDDLLDTFSGLRGSQSLAEPGLPNVRVYLDLNNNGSLDPGEPTQLTSGTAGGVTTTTLDVQGTDAIYLAGRTDVTIPPLGVTDPAFPLQRFGTVFADFLQERKPQSVTATAGDVFTFSATGIVDYNLGSSSPSGPDGLFPYSVPGLGGISAYNGPFPGLVGVFLNDNNPGQAIAPAAINYATVGTNLRQLTPQLGQVFFIGDGFTNTGTGDIQRFIAPDGATRLFVGIADGRTESLIPGLYEDNDGSYRVTINRDRPTQVAGEYRFTGLQPGTYTVRQVVPNGYRQTFPGRQATSRGDGFADVVLEYVSGGTAPRPLVEPYGSTGGIPPGTPENIFGLYTVQPVSPEVVLGAPPPAPIVGFNPLVDWLALPQGSYVTVGFTDETVIDGPGNDIFIRSFDLSDSAGERADVFVSSNGVNFTLLGRVDQNALQGLDLATIGFTDPVRAVRIQGVDNRGTSPGFDLVSVKVLPGSIGAAPDFYTVELKPAEVVDQRNFGNTVSGSTTNQAPVFTSTAPTAAQVGVPFRYEARATDADGDPLTFDLLTSPEGMAIDPARGIVVWQPAPNQLGTASVVLRVRDGQGGSALQSFQLSVGENQPPTIASSPATFARIGAPYAYPVLATDPEGQSLEFSLVNAPQGMTIDAQSGLVQWNPIAAQVGTYPLTIAVRDAQGAIARQSFTLTAGANAVPVITSTPPTSIIAGLTYRYDVQATDPDGDRLTYSLVNAPQGMTLDSLGRLTWSATAANVGTTPVQIAVTDADGAVTTQSFNLTVTPDQQAPKVTVGLSSSTIEVGKTVNFTLSATDDVRAAEVTLTVNGQAIAVPGGKTASLQLDTPGLYTVVATAHDAAGNAGTATTTLRVVDPRDTNAPLIAIASPSSNRTITGLTDIIGSVTDTDLEFYRVEYAPRTQVDFNNLRLADPDFIPLFQGNSPVTNGILAQFDPTLLQNDQYVVRVTAQDVNGNTNAQGILLNVTGENKLGNFRLEFTDLSIPLGGIPITVQRVYDSLQSNQSSDFGFGWSLGEQDARIQESVPINAGEDFGLISLFTANAFKAGDRVTLTNPEGRRVGFTFDPVIVGNSFFGPLWQPRFRPDAGVFDTLSDANDGIRLIQAGDGSFRFPLFSFAYNPTDYKLTTTTGLTYTYDQFEGLEQIRDRNGNTVTFTDAGITSSTGSAIQFARDPQNRITQIIDPAGNAIRYAYNSAGDLVRVTDQAGFTTTHNYLSTRPHYLEGITDARGKAILQTQYDAQGRVIGTTDALGRSFTSTYQFGSDVSTTTQIDPLGNTTITTRDNRGNIIALTDQVNATTLFTYDANNNLISSTDPRGFTTTRSYDSRGNLTQITDPQGQTQSFTYNDFNTITSETDQLGRVTRFVYDSRGNLIELINAVGQTSRFTYDSLGRVASFTDAKNQTTTYGYAGSSDGTLGKPTLITFPDGSTQRVEYNQFGQISRLIDENGNATEYVTDTIGRLITQRDASGNSTTYTYDAQLITSITDPLGNTARFEYDDAGRLIRQTDPLGGVTSFGYDALGRQITETDPLGRTKTTTYRADGIIASIVDAEGNVTRFEYDLTDNQTAIIDPLGQRTTFDYDALGRQIRKTDPLGNSTTYGYDAVGNLIEVIDRNSRRRQFVYNAVDQLTQETWLNGTTPVRTIGLTYDQVGNLISAIDPDSTLTLTYNNRDRLTQVTSSSPTGPTTTLTYTYDAAGNRLSVVDNLGTRVVSTYDPRNLLMSQTWQGGGVDAVKVEYTYDQRGDRTETKRFADVAGTQLVGRTTYTYDASQRLTNLTHFNGSNVALADYQYAYNLANQLTRETVDGQTTTYTYDRTNQLTSADRATQADEAYVYDDNGNRTNNGLIVGVNNQILSDSIFNYAYDNEGNLVTKANIATGSTTTYRYDYRNRLTSVVDRAANGNTTQTVEFTYDAFDRRISKTVNGQTTYLANDGDQLWAEYNQLNQVIARYLPGADIDELIARYRPGDDTSWYLGDRLGTIRDIANQFGSLINQIDYNSFGQILNQTDPGAGDRFAFTGREYDEETGLYYYRARYYDPALGRFISQDPLGFGGEDPNLYRYVGNNPTNATDPSGLIALIEYSVRLGKIAGLPIKGELKLNELTFSGAVIGGLQGFGVTNLIFIGEVLGRAGDEDGLTNSDLSAALASTKQKVEDIATNLTRSRAIAPDNSFLGAYISGVEAKILPDLNTTGKRLVYATGNTPTIISLRGGGFIQGYQAGLAYIENVVGIS